MNNKRIHLIKDIVSGVMQDIKTKKPTLEERLWGEWQEASKKSIIKHTRPVAFKNKCLVVNVDSSSYLYELNLQKDRILNKLKKQVGDKKIQQIRFRIGKIAE